MNARNVITVISVPNKAVSDEFIHAVCSNCTTRVEYSALNKCTPELFPYNFNMAAVGAMNKGMSMSIKLISAFLRDNKGER